MSCRSLAAVRLCHTSSDTTIWQLLSCWGSQQQYRQSVLNVATAAETTCSSATGIPFQCNGIPVCCKPHTDFSHCLSSCISCFAHAASCVDVMVNVAICNAFEKAKRGVNLLRPTNCAASHMYNRPVAQSSIPHSTIPMSVHPKLCVNHKTATNSSTRQELRHQLLGSASVTQGCRGSADLAA